MEEVRSALFIVEKPIKERPFARLRHKRGVILRMKVEYKWFVKVKGFFKKKLWSYVIDEMIFMFISY